MMKARECTRSMQVVYNGEPAKVRLRMLNRVLIETSTGIKEVTYDKIQKADFPKDSV